MAPGGLAVGAPSSRTRRLPASNKPGPRTDSRAPYGDSGAMFRYSALAAFTAALTLAIAGSALAAPGEPDSGFGSDGVVVSNLNPFDGTGFDDVAIGPDGK